MIKDSTIPKTRHFVTLRNLSLQKKFQISEHAIFALRQCVEYFVSRGSTVFMAALDARKAFYRVNDIKLFHLLCDAGIPVHIIRLLMNWYSKF